MNLSAKVQCSKVDTVVLIKPLWYKVHLNGNYSFAQFTLLWIYPEVGGVGGWGVRRGRVGRGGFCFCFLQKHYIPDSYSICGNYYCQIFFCSNAAETMSPRFAFMCSISPYLKHFTFVCTTLFSLISNHLSNLAEAFWIFILSFSTCEAGRHP